MFYNLKASFFLSLSRILHWSILHLYHGMLINIMPSISLHTCLKILSSFSSVLYFFSFRSLSFSLICFISFCPFSLFFLFVALSFIYPSFPFSSFFSSSFFNSLVLVSFNHIWFFLKFHYYANFQLHVHVPVTCFLIV